MYTTGTSLLLYNSNLSNQKGVLIMDNTKNLTPEELQKHFSQLRENQLRQWGVINNPMLMKQIPEIAAELLLKEFKMQFPRLTDLPIVFVLGWKHVMEFVKEQRVPEFSVDVCGVSVEYQTEYSETEKNSNIVPQLFHKRIPLFRDRQHTEVIGSSFKQELNKKYDAWRTENLTETISKLENDVFNELINVYAIDVVVAPTVFATMAAMYAAGVQLAMDTHEEVNMYNIFSIQVFNGDQIVLSPAAIMKQTMKGDAKKL